MAKSNFLFVTLLVITLLFPIQAFAAEVLQVISSSLLLIGDHNRTYTVQLACLHVEAEKELEARSWLKSKLPRRTKVNLLPEGSVDGILIAKVKLIATDTQLIDGLISEDLGTYKC